MLLITSVGFSTNFAIAQSQKKIPNNDVLKSDKDQSKDISIRKNTHQIKKNEEGKDEVVLNFQNTDILSLVDLVSEITGKNFIVDPAVKAKVTVYSGSALNESQLYDVFLSILEVNKLSAVKIGDIIKIIPVAGSKQKPLPTHSGEINLKDISDNLITQVYKLEYATAADILPVIRPLIPAESHVAVHPRSGTLVFTDTKANVKRILSILSHLDVTDTTFNIRIIPLKHAIAEDLREAIAALVGDVISEATPNGTAAVAVVKKRKATVYAERSSNSLIINGSDEAYAIISSLVASLDIERPKTRDLNVVKLKYAKADDMSVILNDVAQKLSPSKPTGDINSLSASGLPANDLPVSVQVHEPSNTLIIYANKPDFLALQSVIDEIDVRRKQVFIEAIIAEVSFNNSADLGVEWTANVDSRGGGTVGTNFTDINGGLRLGVVNKLVLNQLGAAVPDLSVVLSALRSDSSTNILSTPNLLTVDNEEAEIVVGQEVPFITGQFTNNGNQTTTATGNSNNTNNTSNNNPSDGDSNNGNNANNNGNNTVSSVQPFQTIERKDVGLKLTVTPRVNTEGLITMDVEQEISNVSTRNIQGASDLVTDERRITATVQAQSGKIIVIGGLIRDDVFKTDERVPFLGDIPILGNLFKRRSDRAVKTNLMVFLRPVIIDESQPIADQTIEKYDHIRGSNIRQHQRKDNLLDQDHTGSLPPIEHFNERNKNTRLPIASSSQSSLVEMIWNYALPENTQSIKPSNTNSSSKKLRDTKPDSANPSNIESEF